MARSATLTRRGKGFELSVTGNAGTTVIRISPNGALTDLSNAPIEHADVLMVTSVLRGQGFTDMAELVSEWWEG